MTGANTVSGGEHGSDKKIHGDIDVSKVKAPNMFERAKEEFDAVIGVIHQHKSSRDESDKMELKSEKTGSILFSHKDAKKKRNMIRNAKEEIKSLFHSKEKPHRHHHHRKDSHGSSDDIDENTHVDEVKAPNVFDRSEEEIEAVVIDTIHPEKNEIDGSDSPKSSRSASLEKERAGFGCSLGKWLEKICAPWGDNKKD
ncbi:hypothetical protein HID58_046127 [Brassica napus]|uniref:Uncharacterized protein n=1 Tax=Brassica napus TaxID=3708 RepID=A0ABQ8AVJ2_BRANA|nr:hypothetical protein HID58_046127 [Brassica napus]